MDARDRYDSLIRYYSSEYAVPFSLMKAQMLAESNAIPNAVSSVGAKGLAQFMPFTWNEIAPGDDPFNPEHSIRAQCRYMKQLLRLFHGDTSAAIAAYHWGMGHVARHLKEFAGLRIDKLPEETRNYLIRILGKQGKMEEVSTSHLA